MKKSIKFLLCIDFLIFLSALLYARFEFNGFASDIIGKGETGVIDYSASSIYFNPANFTKDSFIASFAVANNYGIENFYTKSISLNFCLKNRFKFGYLFIIDSPFIYYNENLHILNFGFNYSDLISTGINFKFYNASAFLSGEIENDSFVKDLNNKNIDLGIIAKVKKDLKIGVGIINIFSSDIVQSYINAGVQFFFSKDGYFNLNYRFNSNNWRNIINNGKLYFGIENYVFRFLILRAGLSDFNFTLGAGFKLNRFIINYGFYQHKIGISNSISINFGI